MYFQLHTAAPITLAKVMSYTTWYHKVLRNTAMESATSTETLSYKDIQMLVSSCLNILYYPKKIG